MELVAMELKQNCCYVARTLSYEVRGGARRRGPAAGGCGLRSHTGGEGLPLGADARPHCPTSASSSLLCGSLTMSHYIMLVMHVHDYLAW